MIKLKEIKGIGPKTINLLSKLNINNIDDLLSFYPMRYEIIKRSDIFNLEQDDKVIIDGIIENRPSVYFLNRGLDKMSFRLNVGNALLNVVIFNRGFLKGRLPIGEKITIIGKYDKQYNNVIANDIRFGLIGNKESIEPIYRSTYGLTGSKVKDYIDIALKEENIKSYLPEYLMNKYNFINKFEAIKEIHNPTITTDLEKIKFQLKYEELFLFMLQMNYLRLNKNKHLGIKRDVQYEQVVDFINKLPFKLTDDQLTSVDEIYNDLINHYKMNRLLQGDVGSGKTIIAIISIYINYLSGHMSAFMAPTEVLANQHLINIKKIFSEYDMNIVLLTGKLKKSLKDEIHEEIKTGNVDLVIGTHALITSNIEYNNLGLVITDEQHRFGVNQRSIFKNKGKNPDILYMSATPIPRTYALTLYGDMDISTIKTMPSGRKEIKTLLKTDKEIKEVLELMYEELKSNHQIYIIVPLIEESEKLDMDWIEKVEKQYKVAFGKRYNIGSIHGKMTSEEKELVMDKFKENKIQILISTTVIEVGVDVPNATMMVIYDSYRFGLSTLHQLRGRVGRNDLQSYCILMASKETKRLSILTEVNDGFLISEADFKLRGSGDLFGVKQSGAMSFAIANVKEDYDVLLKAQADSVEFLENNKDIVKIENKLLRKIIQNSSDVG